MASVVVVDTKACFVYFPSIIVFIASGPIKICLLYLSLFRK